MSWGCRSWTLGAIGVLVGLAGEAPALRAQEGEPAVGEFNDGTIGHALLGGLTGGYGGLVLGTIATRLSCPGRRDCSSAPAVLGTAAGITLGSYAGVTDRNRAYGGMIGAGIGVFGGALVYVAWSGLARLSHADEPDPFTGFGMALVGGAFGAILGTLVSGSGEPAAVAGEPSPTAMGRLPFGVALSF